VPSKLPKIDQLKLHILLNDPSITIKRVLKPSPAYLISHHDQHWLIWLKSSKWLEVDNKRESIGELHYGEISTFYQKCIERPSKLPPNHGKKWNKDDTEFLYSYISQGKSIVDIADLLGRTPTSILMKASYFFGMSFDHVDPSSIDNDLTIVELIDAGISKYENIADEEVSLSD